MWGTATSDPQPRFWTKNSVCSGLVMYISYSQRAEKVLVVVSPPIGRNIMSAARTQPHKTMYLCLPLTPHEQ